VRITHLIAITAAPVGGTLLGSPADADPAPATGGCYTGSEINPGIVPGTGSAGLNSVKTVSLSNCVSPLLPGIIAGTLTYSSPYVLFTDAPGSGTIAWSNGQRSTISGTLPFSSDSSNVFAITSGPGAGHHMVINTFAGRRRDAVISATLTP
jgi:hypothetical protein